MKLVFFYLYTVVVVHETVTYVSDELIKELRHRL